MRGWSEPLLFDFSADRVLVAAGEQVLVDEHAVTLPWDGHHPVTTADAIGSGDNDRAP